VAGTFYPGQATQLRAAVDDMLALSTQVAHPSPIKALIVPHAGYIYSGPVAATAYAALRAQAPSITRVVLLGPAHRVAFQGLALPGATAFRTPLGDVRVDAADAAALEGVVTLPGAHAQEHSLEVQLPFLQRVLGDVVLVPLCVGDAPAHVVANVLRALWGGPETLILISSDLSHFLQYDEAAELDDTTVQRMCRLDATVTHEQACGATPVNGLLTVGRDLGWVGTPLDVRNSGDTAGTRDRVVGYASVAFG
jgi:AmmeMemoRadiSam system protein B